MVRAARNTDHLHDSDTGSDISSSDDQDIEPLPSDKNRSLVERSPDRTLHPRLSIPSINFEPLIIDNSFPPTRSPNMKVPEDYQYTLKHGPNDFEVLDSAPKDSDNESVTTVSSHTTEGWSSAETVDVDSNDGREDRNTPEAEDEAAMFLRLPLDSQSTLTPQSPKSSRSESFDVDTSASVEIISADEGALAEPNGGPGDDADDEAMSSQVQDSDATLTAKDFHGEIVPRSGEQTSSARSSGIPAKASTSKTDIYCPQETQDTKLTTRRKYYAADIKPIPYVERTLPRKSNDARLRTRTHFMMFLSTMIFLAILMWSSYGSISAGLRLSGPSFDSPVAEMEVRRGALVQALNLRLPELLETTSVNVDEILHYPHVTHANDKSKTKMLAFPQNISVNVARPDQIFLSLPRQPKTGKYPSGGSFNVFKNEQPVETVNLTGLIAGVLHISLDPRISHGFVDIRIASKDLKANVTVDLGSRFLQRSMYEDAVVHIQSAVQKDLSSMQSVTADLLNKSSVLLSKAAVEIKLLRNHTHSMRDDMVASCVRGLNHTFERTKDLASWTAAYLANASSEARAQVDALAATPEGKEVAGSLRGFKDAVLSHDTYHKVAAVIKQEVGKAVSELKARFASAKSRKAGRFRSWIQRLRKPKPVDSIKASWAKKAKDSMSDETLIKNLREKRARYEEQRKRHAQGRKP